MNPTHEVISAFIDNEPFEPERLSEALADPEGRALLIDLLALRRLAQPDDALPEMASPPNRRRALLGAVLAAAAVVVALAGGYHWGERSGSIGSTPPAPTRVISGGSAWQELFSGGTR